jgi:hypothetical protein
MKSKKIIFIMLPMVIATTSIKAQLKVHSTGSVSVGGSFTPFQKLHVLGSAIFSSATSFTSAAYIRGNSSNSAIGSPDYTWYNDDNTGLFHPGQYIIGFTAGGVERMRISSGNVGIGTTSPIQTLDVNGRMYLANGVIQTGGSAITSTSDLGLYSLNNGYYMRFVTNNAPIRFFTDGGTNPTGGTTQLSIESNGNVGIGTTTPGAYKLYLNGTAYSTGAWLGSDERFKRNIKNIENPLEKIMKIRGKTYEYKTDEFKERNFDKGICIGFIAQELKEVLPDAVKLNEDGFYAVNYNEVIPLLVEGIKEQQKIIEELREKVVEAQTVVEAVKTDVNECCKANSDHLNQTANTISSNNSALKQNIPNPFSEKTEINYTIPNSSANVSIAIFDMQGTLLKMFEHLSANNGKGNITINGNEFKAGMYLYSLIIDNKEIDTKRMILTK